MLVLVLNVSYPFITCPHILILQLFAQRSDIWCHMCLEQWKGKPFSWSLLLEVNNVHRLILNLFRPSVRQTSSPSGWNGFTFSESHLTRVGKFRIDWGLFICKHMFYVSCYNTCKWFKRQAIPMLWSRGTFKCLTLLQNCISANRKIGVQYKSFLKRSTVFRSA